MHDTLMSRDAADAAVVRGGTNGDTLALHGRYEVECRDAHGALKWRDTIENLITTVGKDLLLDKVLGNSAAGAVVMGLKGTGTAAAGDTQASHAGWLEVGGTNVPDYTGNRQTPSFAAASAGSKTTSAAVSFAIVTTGGTVAGCFLNLGGSATKDDTTGTLFSAGDFTGGSKVVAPGDTLNVTYTLSV